MSVLPNCTCTLAGLRDDPRCPLHGKGAPVMEKDWPGGSIMHGVIRDTANPKDAAGRAKVALWLLSPIAKAAWAAAAYLGQVKYGAWNYRGTKVYASIYISAAMRHLDAYLSGETYDPEDGTHHLGSVMACCAILLDTTAAGTMIDDRPPRVDLRPAHNEVQTLMPKIEERYADRKPKHWTIKDSTNEQT